MFGDVSEMCSSGLTKELEILAFHLLNYGKILPSIVHWDALLSKHFMDMIRIWGPALLSLMTSLQQ